ncbi:hypothetical protein AB836_02205 [Rickettsiales bacterium (ex Bugula neritina AB1)]|nr:hypothetical protein AB836_02205 [Rickettsiales bacterium (ex Bugula neritina AB1)]
MNNKNIIFVELNECLIGENICLESAFLYLRNNKLKGLKKLFYTKNNNEKRKEIFNTSLINIDNCFLRQEVVEEIHDIIINSKKDNLFTIKIIVPLFLKEEDILNLSNILKEEIIKEEEIYKESINKIEDIICITNEEAINKMTHKDRENNYLISASWKYYKCYFYNIKNVFLGNYIVGLFFDMISTGRTKIIHVNYGFLNILWQYLFSIIDICIFWPYLFFPLNLDVNLLKYTFFISILLNMFTKILRVLLQLEEERKFISKNYECVMGEEFLYDHYSVSNGTIIALIGVFFGVLLSMYSKKSFIFAVLYSLQEFFFLSRTKKEYFISKILVVIISMLLIHPILLLDIFK